MSLRVDPQTTCAEVKAQAEDKIADIDAKIRDLSRMKDALVTLAAACSGRGPTSECPILGALEQQEV